MIPLRPIVLALTLAMALTACGKRQPDFDERYDAASARISEAATDIDTRIAASGSPQGEATDAAR